MQQSYGYVHATYRLSQKKRARKITDKYGAI